MGAMSGEGKGAIKGINGLDPCPAVVLGGVENNISISLGCYPGADQQPVDGGNTVVILVLLRMFQFKNGLT